ncbi:MAG: 16S rRNA (uracil(1498)-N(3))-methyltransferase [Prevotellaceae bacterium]|jgi:16S rRNA (uracil1498-N3)-methyltransferase|nr:16S rRNA (uracil(1498)-N(3))-methyltransferase [Prevotellaceae bacterium]
MNNHQTSSANTQLFYAPDVCSERATLSEEESKHCIRALRLSVGDTIHLTDGRGTLYEARIISTDFKRCEVAITATHPTAGARPYYLHLAVAPTKNIDRYEQLLEKATETGVDEITPLLCAHSERRTLNHTRIEKCLVAAMKQSLKTVLPLLNPLTPFAEFIRRPFDGHKYIGCCKEHIPRTLFRTALSPHSRMLALIGPEGDFSDEEMQQAIQASFRPVTFGPSRFRVETAGMLVCMTAYIMNH